MKITLNTKALLATITALVKVVPAKSALPMLENFLIMADDGLGKVGITASDQETTIVASIPAGDDTECVIDAPGIAAVPARILLEIVKQVEDESVTFETNHNTAIISWESGRGTIPTFDPDDFPKLETAVQDGTDIEIPGKDLADAINATLYAVGEDQVRPIINGIYIHARVDGLYFVASDAHRLAIHSIPGLKAAKEGGFVLHKKNASLIKSLIGGDETVRIRFCEDRATFQIADTSVSVRPIAGKFPDYQKVIPSKNNKILVVDAKLLASVVKRVQVCANKDASVIKLAVKKDAEGDDHTLEVTAQDLGYATAAFEKIAVECSGDPFATGAGEAFTIGYKSSFLIDLLNAFGDQPVRIAFGGEKQAALATPAEPDPEATATDAAVIMPVSIS